MVEHCTVHSFMTLLLSRCLGLLMVSMIFTTDHTHSLSLSDSLSATTLVEELFHMMVSQDNVTTVTQSKHENL